MNVLEKDFAPNDIGNTRLHQRNPRPLRVGIVGTGYIADFHAYAINHAPGVEAVAVCDPNLNRAKLFASQWRISKVFGSLDSMLRSAQLDCVHILAPPDQHYSLAKAALEYGVNVLLEKPMCTKTADAEELVSLAKERQLYLGVSHNFLFSAAYSKLREIVRSGLLGPLDHVTINYFFELGQIRSGLFDSWMFQEPGNVLIETGPHLLSALHDLVGAPQNIVSAAEREIIMPGGYKTFRRWRVRANVNHTAVDLNIEHGPGFSQRTIEIRGLLGSATADLDANTCTVDRTGAWSVDLDRYSRSRSIAKQLKSQAWKTLADYGFTKVGLRSRGNPYQATIIDSVAAFYAGVKNGSVLDERIDGRLGRDVIKSCLSILAAAGVETDQPSPPISPSYTTLAVKPTVLVFGGTGFIGRELIRELLAKGYGVRAAVRGSAAVLAEFDNGYLEIVKVNIESEEDLTKSMEGIEFVYHLARATAKTWEDYLQHDVEPTRLIAKACLAAQVKRLIYTGTIDSYYAGARAGKITDDTPVDPNIRRRNYYARAKAAAEAILTKMHREERLPVVIYRPGIVIGKHGTPFHWGIGMWPSPGVCQVWGKGTNKLPLVLVTDVAEALIRGIETSNIEGKVYNLVDIPLLTARDYLVELQRLAGLRLDIRYEPIFKFYSTDMIKWILKVALRHPDRHRIPSYFDWESRTQRADFESRRARDELGWKPASDRGRIIDEGIGASLDGWLPR